MPPDLPANVPVIALAVRLRPAMHSFHFVTVQTYWLVTELRSLCSLEGVSATKNPSPQPTNVAWS
jgi:hypothetical protein